MADLYNGFNDGVGDPGVGRDPNKFYAFDAKAHADAINQNTHGRPNITSITSSATPAINTDTCTQFNITALATAITSMSSGLSGTPTEGQRLTLRIKDNGAAQTITWGASWQGVGVTLPTRTNPNSKLYVEARYNAADSVWDVTSVRKQIVPVQIMGSASAGANTVPPPAHLPDDLLLVFALNTSSQTTPAPPAAGGTVPAFALVDSASSAAPAAIAIYQVRATANNHTLGTWTNTAAIAVVVLRGEDIVAATPVGSHAASTSPSSATQAVNLALAMAKTDGTSALLYFYAQKVSTGWGAAPAGFTQLTTVPTNGLCVNSKNDTTSDGAATQSLTAVGASAGTFGAAVEIVAAT